MGLNGMKEIIQQKIGGKAMKKINSRRLIYVVISAIWLLFSAAKCSMESRTYPIWVYNNTNHYIDVLLSHGGPLYPDTLLPESNYDKLNPVKPGLGRQYANTLTYREFIQSYNSDTIIIFIFHTDTLSKYTWEEIREYYKILKRYDVSYQEMEKLNGRIYYPPTEAMRDMKMYPPYGQ